MEPCCLVMGKSEASGDDQDFKPELIAHSSGVFCPHITQVLCLLCMNACLVQDFMSRMLTKEYLHAAGGRQTGGRSPVHNLQITHAGKLVACRLWGSSQRASDAMLMHRCICTWPLKTREVRHVYRAPKGMSHPHGSMHEVYGILSSFIILQPAAWLQGG